MPDPHVSPEPRRAALLDAALMHVPFDGWSEETFRAAARDAGIDLAEARILCPRGAVDLAVDYHRRGDAEMVARLAADPGAGLRFMPSRRQTDPSYRPQLTEVSPGHWVAEHDSMDDIVRAEAQRLAG